MPEFSVKKALTVFCAAIAVLVLGVVAYTRMTPDLLPNMDFPYVIIMTTDPGASPESVESEITKPMEQSMATLEGIVNVSSNSSDNYSLVILEFEEGTNLDTTSVDIQQKISVLQAQWDDTVGTPYVLKINPSMLPVAMAAVSMEGMDIDELSEFMEDTLMNRLEGVSGVASVTASGLVDQQLHVVISQEKIDALNEKVADGINKQMDKAAASLQAAKNKINSAMNNLGDIDTSDIFGDISSDADTSEIDAQITAKTQERTTVQNRITELKRIQNALNDGSSSENDAEIKALEEEIAGYNAEIAELQAQVNAIDSKISAEQTAKDSAQAQLDSLGEDADEVQRAALEKTIETCNANIAAYNEEKAPLQADILAAQTAKVTATTQLNLLKSASSSMTEEEAQAELDKLGLSITVDQLDSEITKQTAELNNIDSELEFLRAARQKLISDSLNMPSSDDVGDMLSTVMQSMLQMSSAMSQIDSGLNSIESSRKDALAQANLDNILSLDTVSQILYAQNFSMPAGYVEQDGISYMVSVGDNFSTVKELEDLMLFDFGLDDMEPIYLSDVADIFVTDNSENIYTRLGTENGLMLSFEKQSNYATAEVSESIRERFDELEEQYDGLKFFLLMDQGEYIEYVVDSILESLFSGALFSVLILFIFLRDIRPTFITLISIPLSVMFALVLMYFSGITLNIISLAGLSIAVGMLVDNSVVVIENIYRLRAKGANAIQSAVSGAKQVLGAITSSTLTTVCVFLPIVFVEGITKQLFTDLALTMGYSLMASLIIALTLVPAMASKMLKDDKPLKKDILSSIYDKYRPAVAWAIDHKAIVLGGSLLLLVLTSGLAVSRGFSFMPSMDSNTVTVTVTFDEETEKQDAMDITDEAIKRIMTIEEVDTVGATMGGTSLLSSGDGSTTVTMYVTLPDGVSGSDTGKEILQLCEDLDCEISYSSAMMDMSMLTGSGVALNIYGNDMEDLQTAAATIAAAMEELDGIAEVSDGLEDATTAIHINVDRNKAMEKGFTTAQIYMQLAAGMTTTATATSFDLEGTNIDVIVEQPEERNITLDNLLTQTFTASSTLGESEEFTLADVATIEETTSLATINRDNQRRYLTVSATLEEGYNVTLITSEVESIVKGLELPDSVEYEFNGENEVIMEAMVQLVLMLLLGILLVYFIMVAQFQSLKSPFIVMFTIPLAFTGGFMALLLTGMEVSIIAMIGFVMLVGIIVNNGIVLVDYINQLRLEGMERREAILEAGVTRIRPILMTSLTTILGLIVMAMGKDMGTALVQPIAIVCIGGLLYATLMTLFVVPCIYDIMNKKDMEKVSDDDLVILDI